MSVELTKRSLVELAVERMRERILKDPATWTIEEGSSPKLLPPEQRTQLGRHNAQLGHSAVAGKRIWDYQSCIRIELGPLNLADYQRFQPGTGCYRKLVELVRGIATDETTFRTAKEFVSSLDKTITVAEDFPAFIVNRILLPMINEAVFVLGQSTAGIEDIDKGCRLGLNHPMGPLELADFIGLDTCLDIINVLYTTTRDSKYRPAPLLVKYVEAGWLGRKTGRGVYRY